MTTKHRKIRPIQDTHRKPFEDKCEELKDKSKSLGYIAKHTGSPVIEVYHVVKDEEGD